MHYAILKRRGSVYAFMLAATDRAGIYYSPQRYVKQKDCLKAAERLIEQLNDGTLELLPSGYLAA